VWDLLSQWEKEAGCEQLGEGTAGAFAHFYSLVPFCVPLPHNYRNAENGLKA
jgi:hypothetical protein